MRCICITKCFLKNSLGRSQIFSPGMIGEFDKCPTHFDPIDLTVPADFAKDSEDMLLIAKWTYAEASKAINKLYKVKLKKGNKADLIGQILYARENFVNPDIAKAK